jgi:site-specific DNA-methyltransferase (adenine-specific)
LTDPPYGLGIFGKVWDKAVPPAKVWKQNFRVLKPGAFSFIMSSPRQDLLSQTIANLQNAGFDTGFTSLYWTYATGFSKAVDISKAVDKRLGVQPEVIGRKWQDGPKFRNAKRENDNKGFTNSGRKSYNVTKPASQEAKALAGYYGGFQPKPAVEVVLVAMKPLSEKSFDRQALENGKGITNLDACNIPSDDRSRRMANLLVSDQILDSCSLMRRCSEKPLSRYYDLDSWFDKKLQEFQLESLSESIQKTYPFLMIPKPSKAEKQSGLETLSIQYAHPTAKPIELMCLLVTLASKKGEIVLDPYLGSGTTALASRMLGRDFVGIEIDPAYCKAAQMRLSAMSGRCSHFSLHASD